MIDNPRNWSEVVVLPPHSKLLAIYIARCWGGTGPICIDIHKALHWTQLSLAEFTEAMNGIQVISWRKSQNEGCIDVLFDSYRRFSREVVW